MNGEILSSVLTNLPLICPILTCVDPDPYSEYGSGSTKLLNTDPNGIQIQNTASNDGKEIGSTTIKQVSVYKPSPHSREFYTHTPKQLLLVPPPPPPHQGCVCWLLQLLLDHHAGRLEAQHGPAQHHHRLRIMRSSPPTVYMITTTYMPHRHTCQYHHQLYCRYKFYNETY